MKVWQHAPTAFCLKLFKMFKQYNPLKMSFGFALGIQPIWPLLAASKPHLQINVSKIIAGQYYMVTWAFINPYSGALVLM